MERIYFDNAATTKIAPQVLLAMEPYMYEFYGNPSSLHKEGREAKLAVETARKNVAALLECKPNEIVFTSGGTESNNIALRCGVRDLKVDRIITARTEHHAVLNTVRSLHQSGQTGLDYVALNPDGTINLPDLDRLLSNGHGKALVSLMHANNETGNMINLERVGEICKRHNAVFHSDTVQTVGHFGLSMKSLGVDMATGAGHKFHGPKGVGILYVRDGLGIKAMTTGGGHERGFRAGTENVPGIVGFAAALELANDTLYADMSSVRGMKDDLRRGLEPLGVSFNGDISVNSLYTVLNCAFPNNEKTEALLFNLDTAGISASGGSACSAGSGSHVMDAMGAGNTINIRFSFSRYNTQEQISRTIEAIKQFL